MENLEKNLLDVHMCWKCWKQIKWMRWRLKFQKNWMWKKCTMDGWFFEKDGKFGEIKSRINFKKWIGVEHVG